VNKPPEALFSCDPDAFSLQLFSAKVAGRGVPGDSAKDAV
jgi:hypothetical protein